MGKRKGPTPEQDIIEFFERMGLTPEGATDIYEARRQLTGLLEGSPQYETTGYGLTAAQLRTVDNYVYQVAAPMNAAGVRATIGWNVQGYYEVRYIVAGQRGLWGWNAARDFIYERTHISIGTEPWSTL